MRFKSVILIAIIVFAVQDSQSFKVWGKNTNLTLIYQRIRDISNKLLPYADPDLTIYRKNMFDDSIILVVKKPSKVKSTISENELKYDIDAKTKKDNKSIRRQLKGLKKYKAEKAKAELVKSQHDKKVNVIIEFLEDHYLTTNYLYDEVLRIKRQKKVKDDLRRMVEYLEKPDKAKMKEEVLKCYYEKRKTEVFPEKTNKQFDTNNLVINIMKDPYNYGFIN